MDDFSGKILDWREWIAPFLFLILLAFVVLVMVVTFFGPRLLIILFLVGPVSLYMGLPILIAVLLPRLVVTFFAGEEPDIPLLAASALLLGVFCFVIMFGATTRLQASSIADNKQFVDEASKNRGLGPRQWQNNAPDRTAVINEIWFSLALPPAQRNRCFSGKSLICARADEAKTHYRKASWAKLPTLFDGAEPWQKSYEVSIILSATVAFISSLLLFAYYVKSVREMTPMISTLVGIGLIVILVALMVA
jgi:hypothetical protein